MQNFFMGGDRWGQRIRPSLGQGLTNGDAVRILKDSVGKQSANRERNDALPEDFQLSQENDILPVDQILDDQSKAINQFNSDKGVGWYWDQPADKALMNAALSAQALVNALDRRIMEQEARAEQGIPLTPPTPSSKAPVPTVQVPPSPKSSSGAIVLVGIAAAAFVGAVFLSKEEWSGLPWSESPREPFLQR